MTDIYEEAKSKALKYLAFKARTYKEVEQKLKEKGYGEITIEDVMAFLEEYKYVNDAQYALSFIKYAVNNKNHGKKRISYDLQNRGVSSRIIANAFLEFEENTSHDYQENIAFLIEKKLKGEADIDLKQKKRLFDYLARRGFSYDDINSAMKKIIP